MTSMPGGADGAAGKAVPRVKDKRQNEWTRHQFDNVKQTMCRSRKKGKAGASGRPGGGQQQQQYPGSLQLHIDREDRRVKELTEGLLYEFLPAALNVMVPPPAAPSAGSGACEEDEPSRELKPERCKAVAGAALAVAALMNAPPGFLEFLCCVPWGNLAELYPSFRPEAIEALMPQMQVSDEERKQLVNLRLHPALMGTVLDFLYRPQHADSVPPGIQLVDDDGKYVSRDMVAALLDGATPLHCAAIRGNPAQVDHLLSSGADLYTTTSAGELPLELVPVCSSKGSQGGCCCMGSSDQEVWKCLSADARSKIVKRSLLNFRHGLLAWARMCMLVLLCLLGAWGLHPSLDRPAVEKHVRRRADAKRQDARRRAQTLLQRMRAEAVCGAGYLEAAERKGVKGGVGGGGKEGGDGSTPSSGELVSAGLADLGLGKADRAPPSQPPVPQQWGSGGAGAARIPAKEAAEDAEKAFECFVRAVHALQGLDLRGGTLPAGFAECGLGCVPECNVQEDEQADLYCCWARSVLVKFRGCTCQGCAALAVQAIRMAHVQGARLFARAGRVRDAEPDRWNAVGRSLVRIIHAHVCLLLETEARQSAMRASVWQAQQCLQEWEKMRGWGLAQEAGLGDSLQVQCLEQWARTADSDLLLAEALADRALMPTQPLAEVLPTLVAGGQGPGGGGMPGGPPPSLQREVGKDTAELLEQALRGAPHASNHLAQLTRAVADNARRQVEAAERLRDVMANKGGGGGGGGASAAATTTTCSVSSAVGQLTEAIHAAQAFPHLQAEVNAALQLRERWIRRAEAVSTLDAVLDEVAARPGFVLQTGTPQELALFKGEWDTRTGRLESAIEEARQAGIGVSRAKRLLRDLQAQASAVDCGARLDELLSHPPCGSAPLKAGLAKADAAAAAAAATNSSSGLVVGSDFLAPRIQSARRQLEVERAAEALAKAAFSAKAVGDLPRLEAAILAARKVGAEELDPESYRLASDARARLDAASRQRQVLECAVKALQRGGRQEDAEAVDKVVEECSDLGDLLSQDVAKAQDEVTRWRCATSAEAKLGRALRDGTTTHQLSRIIQEAAAVGVKVGEAKKALKLMLGLEAAMQAAAESTAPQPAPLKAKIEAAEQGGCPGALLDAARSLLHRLQVAEAKGLLEAALKPRSGQSSTQRSVALQLALDKAQELLGAEELQRMMTSTQQEQVDEEKEGQQAAAKQAPGQGQASAEVGGSQACQQLSSLGEEAEGEQGSGASDKDQGQGNVKQQEGGRSATSEEAQSQVSAASAAAAGDSAAAAGDSAADSEPSSQPGGSSTQGSPERQGVPATAAASGVDPKPLSNTAAAAATTSEDVTECATASQVQADSPRSQGAGGEPSPAAVAAEEEEEDDDLVAVRRMTIAAQRQLAAEEKERERIEQERQQELRLRRDRLLREKAERDRADRERQERDKSDRERSDKERASRRERERHVREVLAAISDKSRYTVQKALREREGRAAQQAQHAKQLQQQQEAMAAAAAHNSRLNPNTPPFEPSASSEGADTAAAAVVGMSPQDAARLQQLLLLDQAAMQDASALHGLDLPDMLSTEELLQGAGLLSLQQQQQQQASSSAGADECGMLSGMWGGGADTFGQQAAGGGGTADQQPQEGGGGSSLWSSNDGLLGMGMGAPGGTGVLRSQGSAAVGTGDLAFVEGLRIGGDGGYHLGGGGGDIFRQQAGAGNGAMLMGGGEQQLQPVGAHSQLFPDLGGASWGMDAGAMASLPSTMLGTDDVLDSSAAGLEWGARQHASFTVGGGGAADGTDTGLLPSSSSPLSSSLGALGFVSRDDMSLGSLLQQQQQGADKQSVGSGLGPLGMQRPSTADQLTGHPVTSSSLAGNLAFGAPGSAAFSSTGGGMAAGRYGDATSSSAAGGGDMYVASTSAAVSSLLPDSESSLFESSILLTPGQKQQEGGGGGAAGGGGRAGHGAGFSAQRHEQEQQQHGHPSPSHHHYV